MLGMIPILGWIFASSLEHGRNYPVMNSIAEQLKRRDAIPSDDWGVAVDRREFAEFFCNLVRDAFSWPNSYFIPSDPFELLFIGDDGEGASIFESVEEYLSLRSGTLSEDLFETMRSLSLGQAIDYMLGLRQLRVNVAHVRGDSHPLLELRTGRRSSLRMATPNGCRAFDCKLRLARAIANTAAICAYIDRLVIAPRLSMMAPATGSPALDSNSEPP